VDVARRVGRLLEAPGRLCRQKVERPHGIQSPPARVGQVTDDILDDRQERLKLVGRTVEVVGRKQPEGDDLDADILAPAKKRRDVVSARLVPLRGVCAVGLGPSAVPIEHDTDVTRHALRREAGGKPTLVRAVQQVTQPHGRPP